MQIIYILFISIITLNAAFPQWYYEIKSPKERKSAFLNILLPLIEKENFRIMQIRKKVIYLFNKNDLNNSFLIKIAKEYKIKNINNKEEFLKKINFIPPSLALAQAAIESGWGKSRFVKEANNIFGHWEYSNKGIPSKSKYENIKIVYTLKKFKTLEESIKVYMRNLNRNRAYRKFRNIREKYINKHILFTGILAADGLKNYSQLKEKYVKLLKKLIKSNNWTIYDKGY